MSHQSDRIYYKQPIKFLVLKVNGMWEDSIPIQLIPSRGREPRVASLFFRATAFFLIYLFFGVFNLTLTFSSVNDSLCRRNTSFRFSFVREFRESGCRRLLKVSLYSDVNEILSFPRKFLYQNVDYVKLTNIQIYTGKRSSEANFR